MVLLCAVAALQLAVVRLPADVRQISFVDQDRSLLIETSGTNQSSLYISGLKGPARLLTKANNYTISNKRARVVTEQDGQLTFWDLAKRARIRVSRGTTQGGFAPSDGSFAFSNQGDPLTILVVDIGTGKVRRLSAFRTALLKRQPPHRKPDGSYVYSWTPKGIVLAVSYAAPNGASRSTQYAFVDPATGALKSVAAGPDEGPLRLADGSSVFDELANTEDSMMGGTRIVRVAGTKRTVLYEGSGMSSGHEGGAGYVVGSNRVLVFGVSLPSESSAAIYSVDPLSGKKSVLISGPYKMPAWADGTSMAVALSRDGNVLAYDGFLAHSRVFVRVLP